MKLLRHQKLNLRGDVSSAIEKMIRDDCVDKGAIVALEEAIAQFNSKLNEIDEKLARQ